MIKFIFRIEDENGSSTCFQWPYLGDYDKEVKLWYEMEEWCEKNCKGRFISRNSGLYIFNDNEAMRFRLVFG